MLKLLIKAVILFAPFLKNIIFKDRTVKEVLADNRQFTRLFGLLVVVVITLYMTVVTLAETKEALAQTQHELEQLKVKQMKVVTPPTETMDSPTPQLECDPALYDKLRLIEVLSLATSGEPE